MRILVLALAISVATQAFALDDAKFRCYSAAYWMAKASYAQNQDTVTEMIAYCDGRPEEDYQEAARFVETVEAGNAWYFSEIYGADKFEIFKSISKDSLKVVNQVEANLLQRDPLK